MKYLEDGKGNNEVLSYVEYDHCIHNLTQLELTPV